MTPTEIQTRITQIKDVDLPAIQSAIVSIATGQHQSYTLDTGQSTQSVKRLSLDELRIVKKDLENELARLENSMGASGQIGRPFF